MFTARTSFLVSLLHLLSSFASTNNFSTTEAQPLLISPCPRLFVYEPTGQENDKWYGILTLVSDSELSGVWLRLMFDKPTVQIGNWFGEVSTKDNRNYLIRNPNKKLPANTTFNLRFYVKYDPVDPMPPRLVSFRLNTKKVCPEDGLITEPIVTTRQPITSSEAETSTPKPTTRCGGNQNGNVFDGGSGPAVIRPGCDDDDFFHGDLSLLRSPQVEPNGKLDVACGTVIQPPQSRTRDIQATFEGEFPWHGAIYHAKGIDLIYICGASILTKQHILTAAHCVTGRDKNAPLNPDGLVVYLGKFDLRRWSNPSIQIKHIQQITVHPEYNGQTFINDIAVIKLSSEIEFTNSVRPVCLWDGDIQLQSETNDTGTIVGWGFDGHGRVSEQLTKANMSVVPCTHTSSNLHSSLTSNKIFCSSFQHGTSICTGDSGGGMVVPRRKNTQQTTIWRLRGVVSMSVALQNQLKCDVSHHAVFTDVAKYLDWIKTSVNYY